MLNKIYKILSYINFVNIINNWLINLKFISLVKCVCVCVGGGGGLGGVGGIFVMAIPPSSKVGGCIPPGIYDSAWDDVGK